MGVRRGRARHGRRLPRARPADHRRQRQLLQRDGRGGRDPAHADDRPGRPARRRAPRRARRLPRPRRRRDLPGRDARRARRQRVPVRAPRPRARRAAGARPRGREAPARAPGRPGRAAGCVRSAHDCSDGGAAIALAECAIRAGVGVEAELPGAGLRPELAPLRRVRRPRDPLLRARADRGAPRARARDHGVPAARIGRTGGARLRISPGVDVSVAEAHDAWARTLPEALG